MIISHERQYVFIAVPKTGSVSIRHLLLNHCDGQEVGYHHATRIPTECHGYLAFAVVRNPYARFWSLYRHVCRDHQHRCHRLALELGLAGFARWQADRSLEPRVDFTPAEAAAMSPDAMLNGRDANQSEFLAGLPSLAVLRFESLREGLRGLPFIGDSVDLLPRLNDGGLAADWRDAISPYAEHWICRWAGDDFERFGYLAALKGPSLA